MKNTQDTQTFYITRDKDEVLIIWRWVIPERCEIDMEWVCPDDANPPGRPWLTELDLSNTFDKDICQDILKLAENLTWEDEPIKFELKIAYEIKVLGE